MHEFERTLVIRQAVNESLEKEVEEENIRRNGCVCVCCVRVYTYVFCMYVNCLGQGKKAVCI